jgi:hypothetical protein
MAVGEKLSNAIPGTQIYDAALIQSREVMRFYIL